MFIEYAVIDDMGDAAETGQIAHRASTLNKCAYWAEDNNYHSASIVKITDGKRVKLSQDDIDTILKKRT
jgi:hypothetical protein